MATIHHSTYDLLPKTPSSTHWLIEDADNIPQKLLAVLKDKPKLVGTPNLGETYVIEDITWDSPPALHNAFHNEMTTRTLKLSWLCLKNAGGRTQAYRIPLKIQGVPYPNTKGAYTYGSDEYYVTNILRQKNGVFPVSTEERLNAPPTQEILWKTLDVTFLQNSKFLIVQALKKTGQPENTPVYIPKKLWPEFANALTRYRNKSNSNISFSELPDNKELVDILKKGLNFKSQEHTSYQINQWLLHVADAVIPQGSWTKRMDTLKTYYPELAEDISTLKNTTQWNIAAARAAENLREQLPEKEFLPPHHMGRLYLETGANHTTAWILGQINQIFTDARTHTQKQNDTNLTILTPWARHNWETEIQHFFISPQMPKVINEAPTPEATTIKALLIKNDFALFEKTTGQIAVDGDRTPDIERAFHSSQTGYIATATPDSANVGVDHWPCAGARRDPLTGEMLKPVMIKQENGSWKEEYMNAETYESLERDLAAKNLGVHIGIPDPKAKKANLRSGLDLTAQVPPKDVPAYVNMKPHDMLPMHIPMSAKIHPSRFPMAHSGTNNGRTCLGSEPPQNLTPEIEEAMNKLTNIGSTLVAPASGKVTSIRTNGAFQQVTIQTNNGDLHVCQIPQPKSNAFKNPIGTSLYVKIGDSVTENHVFAGPPQTAYKNQIAGKPPKAIHTGINLKAIIIPLGIEDQILASEHIVASGRLNQPATHTIIAERQNHPIHIKRLQPGTKITPNETLAYQIVNGETIPILTGPTEGGILQKVTFVQDQKNPKLGTPVILEENPEKTTLRKIIDLEIQEAIKGLTHLRNRLDKNYIQQMQDKGTDPLPCIEQFKAAYTNETGNRVPVEMTLQELQTKEGRNKIAAILTQPNHNIQIPKEHSYLNERMLYTLHNIQEIQELLRQNVAKANIPKTVKSVAFEIKSEKTFGHGSKLSDPEGTKGTTVITPYMPFIPTENGPKPAEVAFTPFAAFARGSLDKFDRKSDTHSVLILNRDGKLQEIKAEVLSTYYKVQKSDTTFNKVQGRLTKQGADFRGNNIQGVNVSNESNVLAHAMLPVFIHTAATPQNRRLEEFEHQLSRLEYKTHAKPQEEPLGKS
jgi:hypothetical protein